MMFTAARRTSHQGPTSSPGHDRDGHASGASPRPRGLREPRARRLAALLAAPALAAAVAACGSSSGSTAKAGTDSSAGGTGAHSNLTFNEIYQGCPSDPFWAAVDNGAHAAARDLGVHVVVSAPTDCGNVGDEEALLHTAIGSHPAGIAVSVIDARAFSSDIQAAHQQGIPIDAYNTEPENNNPSTNPYQAYIGQPNYTAGYQVGKQAITTFHLSKGSVVAVINQEPTNVSLSARYQGVSAAMKTIGATAIDVNSTGNASQGANIVSSLLQKNKAVKVLVSLGPVSTAQAGSALQQQGLLGKTGLCSFDLDSVTLHYIEQGDDKFTDDQQPFLEGYDSLMELYQEKVYHSAPVDISTGPVFITSQNVKALAPYVNQTGF
jgi:ABC-type sugar transport system substrate-binding protein